MTGPATTPAYTTESAAKAIESLLSDIAPETKPAVEATPKVEETAHAEEPTETEETAEEAAPAEEAEAGEEQEAEPEPQPRKFKVVSDGIEEEVTEDELLKGYSRQKHFTRATQALADERKNFETAKTTELSQVQTHRQELEQRLTAVHEVLTALTPAEPDWNALRQVLTPDQVNAEYAAFKQHQERLDGIKQARDATRAANEKDLSAKADEFLNTERAKLREAIPEWQEPEKFKAGLDELHQFATNELGFSQAELNTVVDSRLVQVLRMAKLYKDGLAAKPKVTQKIADAMRTTAPSAPSATRPTSELTKAKQRVAKTGKVEDAARAIEALL